MHFQSKKVEMIFGIEYYIFIFYFIKNYLNVLRNVLTQHMLIIVCVCHAKLLAYFAIIQLIAYNV